MLKYWLTKSKPQYNLCQPLSLMNPILFCWVRHVLTLVYFYSLDKIPDGYRWQWIWGLLWGELGLGSTSRPDPVALETPWSCFRFIFPLSRLWVCLFMYWTKVRYCNKAPSLIFFLYNLFYMFHTYGLPPIFGIQNLGVTNWYQSCVDYRTQA
jgi:hypothetical protein